MTEFDRFKGRALLIGTDAEFYFDREQFDNLRNTPLEGEFEDMNKGWNFEKFTITFLDELDGIGDGIESDVNPDTNVVEITLNEHACDYIRDRGEWGSIWMMGERIKFSLAECPLLTKEEAAEVEARVEKE